MQNTISNFLIQDGVLPFNTPVSSPATPIINDLNIENIRSQIRQKNSTTPFLQLQAMSCKPSQIMIHFHTHVIIGVSRVCLNQ